MEINQFDLTRIMVRIKKAENGCWIWQGSRQLQIWLNDSKAPARVTRLLYNHFNDKPCDNYQIGFKCNDPMCVNPTHAYLVGKITRKKKPGTRPKSFVHQSAKFWAHVSITETCWLWQGTKQSNGYGLIRLQGKPQLAHAAAYKLFFGDTEQGLEIHHTCQNKLCVNPAHLKPLSRNEHKRLHAELRRKAQII